MILHAFSVYDKAVGSYLPPVFVRSKGEMLRNFQSAVNSQDHQFHKYAADYTLFYVGAFNDMSGIFTHCEPERVIGALEVRDDPFKPELEVASRSGLERGAAA